MTRPISLAHLTVIDLAPPAMIRLAADLGYDAVGLRADPRHARQPRLSADGKRADDARNPRRAGGIPDCGVQDIEFVRIPIDPARWRVFWPPGRSLAQDR